MKTFKEFIKEENAKIIEVMGEATFFEEKLFFADEVIEMVERWQLLQQCNVSGSLPPVEVRKKADKIGKQFKRKWEAKYVGFGDGSTIELWWRHQIEDAFGGNDR